MSYNVASLFAGIGGICRGFQKIEGYTLVAANEMDPDACVTYTTNFKHSLAEGDIEKILNPNFIKEEREHLLKNREMLKKYSDLDGIYDSKFTKECITKLYKNFISKSLKNNFDFTPGLIKKSIKLNIDIDKFKKYIEYKLILKSLEVVTEDYVIKKIEHYSDQREKLLKNKVDILTAGFPCQAFSIAGNRKGFKDHRGELFYSVLEFVKQLESAHGEKPRVILLENVKNLEKHDDGKTYKRIINEIEALNYISDSWVLNTYKYTNLPQNRERIFIVCFREEEDYRNFKLLKNLPQKNHTEDELKKMVKNIFDSNISLENDLKYYYTPEKFPHYFLKKGSEIPKGKERVNLKEQIVEDFTFYQLRRGQYVRQNKSFVCPTLTADMGCGGHNVALIKVKDGIRKLTPKECFKLQGFNIGKDYQFPKIEKNSALYKQAGNSVSVDVIELIAKEIKKALDKNLYLKKEES